ncbi:MAG: hypothetical protein R8K22_01275, partial [Mariprofundaceae bacterium]
NYAVAEENIAGLYIKLALQYYRSALEQSPNDALEKRYARLLQVRDPRAGIADVANSLNITAERKEHAPIDASMVIEATKSVPIAITEDMSNQQDSKAAVLAVLETWRRAWATQDLPHYFAAYSESFEVPKRFNSLSEWKKYKHRVIANKKFIDVQLTEVEVIIDKDGSIAQVQFEQHFRSNSYNGVDLKVLEMEVQNGVWKIMREESVS